MRLNVAWGQADSRGCSTSRRKLSGGSYPSAPITERSPAIRCRGRSSTRRAERGSECDRRGRGDWRKLAPQSSVSFPREGLSQTPPIAHVTSPARHENGEMSTTEDPITSESVIKGKPDKIGDEVCGTPGRIDGRLEVGSVHRVPAGDHRPVEGGSARG